MTQTRLAFLAVIVCLSSGCSIINLYDDGIKVSSYVGLPIYLFKPNNKAVYLDITGMGLITSPDGVSFGYMQQVYAQIPKGTCSVVVFTQSKEQSRDLIAYFKDSKTDLNNICLTHKRD